MYDKEVVMTLWGFKLGRCEKAKRTFGFRRVRRGKRVCSAQKESPESHDFLCFPESDFQPVSKSKGCSKSF